MNISMEQLEKIALSALEKSYETHQKLGISGEKLIKKNKFGETALIADIEMEKAIISVLREANVPIKIISEEHGTTQIENNPIFLGVLDGLDGSNVYKKERGKGRYGTIFGIFSNLDPKYNDIIFSGVMEHSTKRLYYSVNGKGSFLIDNGKIRIKCSNCKSLDKDTNIYVDEFFDNAFNTNFIYDTYLSKLGGYKLLHKNSSAVHYVDLASGKVDLVLECTRKGNLEIAAAYGLISESKGEMLALDGTSLGPKKYLEFGQDKYVPVISSSTKELAKELIEKIT